MIMKSVKQVEEILEENPEARSNDFLLCWLWLQEYEGLDLPELKQKQLNELNGKFSTLTRWRRKIQAAGKYMPTKINDLDNRRLGVKPLHKGRYLQKPKSLEQPKMQQKNRTRLESAIGKKAIDNIVNGNVRR